jgi:hypothetical protein
MRLWEFLVSRRIHRVKVTRSAWAEHYACQTEDTSYLFVELGLNSKISFIGEMDGDVR